MLVFIGFVRPSRSMCSVAVIGGGITGATAVSVLVDELPPSSTVTLFDQGRGLGGRTSHRRVRVADGVPCSPECDGTKAFRFESTHQPFPADGATCATQPPSSPSTTTLCRWQGCLQ